VKFIIIKPKHKKLDPKLNASNTLKEIYHFATPFALIFNCMWQYVYGQYIWYEFILYICVCVLCYKGCRWWHMFICEGQLYGDM